MPLALGQELDTTRVIELDPVTVTADRGEQELGAAVSSVSLVRAEALRPLPVSTVAEALETLPGFAFLNLDGQGYEPQLTVRGFYGGGEAEYVTVLVNGRPFNGLTRGLVDWNLVSLGQVEAIEAVRGGASSLYGDAAIGGVINLITDPFGGSRLRAHFEGGSYETAAGGLRLTGTAGGRAFALYGSGERTDGYRDNATRAFGTVGGDLELVTSPRGALRLSTLHYLQDYDTPGPLPGFRADADPGAASVFYRFDGREERLNRLSLSGEHRLSRRVLVSGDLIGELRGAEVVRTLELAPGFADTQARDLSVRRAFGSAQATIELPLPSPSPMLPMSSRLTLGGDASAGTFTSAYAPLAFGDSTAYLAADGEAGDVNLEGDGHRLIGALYTQYDVFVGVLRLTLGARFDAVGDRFEPDGGEASTITHTALSPKAGLGLRYVSTSDQVGNAFVNVFRSFKTPTLDQLYDQRQIFIETEQGPVAIDLSTPTLDPQRGIGVEAGLTHRAELIPDQLGASFTLTLYQIDMRDELDFLIPPFEYVNLGRSRHRGVETGLALSVARRGSAFMNYTNQTVTLEYGEFDGNYVKAIPRDVLTAGLTAALPAQFEVGLKMSTARRIFLDDANTIPLPEYTRVDAKLSFTQGAVTASASVQNLFDERYSTTGFPDPSGFTDVVYYYPAAGRHLRLGLRLSL